MARKACYRMPLTLEFPPFKTGHLAGLGFADLA